jgi:phosphonate transport system substrate-binding protein
MAIGRRLVGLAALCLALAPASAHAGWREDIGVFRIGMVATPGNGAVVEGGEAIRAAYAAALGMPVEIFVARDYAVLIDAQASGRIEYAVHTAASYAAAWGLCSCVEPVAAPVSADGATGIRAVLVARADGPASADALAGAKVAFGPPDSVAGHALPLAEFRPGGVALTGSEPFLVPVASETEAEARFAAGEVGAMFGFVQSSSDEGASAGGTPDRLARLGQTGVRTIWTSDLVRYGPHAVRGNLPDEAKEALRAFLVGLRDADPKVYESLERRFSGGFAAALHEDYGPAIDMVRLRPSTAAKD